MTNEQINNIISKMSLHDKIMFVTGKNSWRTREYPEYGIPSIMVSDGTSGVRCQKGSDTVEEVSFYDSLGGSFDNKEALERTWPATCFPSGSAIACAWNKELIYEIGQRLADECKALGINILLGPGMNIHRHPLTARNFEYYSEDPVITGEMAASIVKGVQSQGVGTCMKHFACHNSDSRRTRVNVQVSERALREIYLAGYERVVQKAAPVSLMSAYNQVNGEEMSGDNRITRDILKGEWGFDGTIICDWGAVKDPIEGTKGRIDLQMPFSPASADYLENAIKDGRLDESLLDLRVERLLKLVFKMKEWEAEWGQIPVRDNHALAVDAAAQCIVLLKNEENILPIRDTGKIAIIGNMAKEPIYQGTGCAVVHPKKIDIPYDNICKYVSEENLSYAQGYFADGTSTDEMIREAAACASGADKAIVFVGSFLPGEDDDYNRKDIRLLPDMVRLIEEVSKVNSNVIVCLASGEVCEMPWREQVKGLVLTWFSGEGMGTAIADIIFGKISPSGRLANTIPERLEDTPAFLSFYGNEYELPYAEDIYVGYRYYDRKKTEPAYPFGYGLSYTTFAYSEAAVSEDGSHVTVKVTNTGDMAAREVVQLYIRPIVKTRLPRPVRELKAFEKVDLAPGESKVVSFNLCERDFAYYDPKGAAWAVDGGEYAIELAHSSREILQTVVVTREANVPKVPFNASVGFHELFADPTARKMFYDFLVEQGLVRADQVDDKLEKGIIWSFWAIRSYLDMNAGNIISFDAYNAFLEKVNAELFGK